ncbi:hypothetical protein DXG01_001424 [Tephrocybe rancida]|nr:hypothetical protein DXG01_001424 [Tephrocybe rancida]
MSLERFNRPPIAVERVGWPGSRQEEVFVSALGQMERIRELAMHARHPRCAVLIRHLLNLAPLRCWRVVIHLLSAAKIVEYLSNTPHLEDLVLHQAFFSSSWAFISTAHLPRLMRFTVGSDIKGTLSLYTGVLTVIIDGGADPHDSDHANLRKSPLPPVCSPLGAIRIALPFDSLVHLFVWNWCGLEDNSASGIPRHYLAGGQFFFTATGDDLDAFDESDFDLLPERLFDGPGRAPELKRLELSNNPLEWHRDVNNLRFLDIGFPFMSLVETTVNYLFNTPHLEELGLLLTFTFSSTSFATVVHLPRLVRLALDSNTNGCMQLLEHLIHPPSSTFGPIFALRQSRQTVRPSSISHALRQ